MKLLLLALFLLTSCCAPQCENLPPITGKEITDCEGNLIVVETVDINMFPFPPTLAIDENITIFMKMSLLKAKEQDPNIKILRQEKSEEGFFAVQDVPKGLYKSIDCSKGCLAYTAKDRLIIISYLVPSEKEMSVECIREKLIKIKRNLVSYL